MSERPILLQADHLKKWFPVRKGVFSKAAQYVKAVDDVSLVIREGETLGIVGESGCGKSTLARTMMRLIEPTEGTVLFQGQDLTSADKESLRRMRRDIQIIFQDPYASLNPRQRVSDILAEPFLIHKLGSREAVSYTHLCRLWHGGRPAAGPVPVLRRGAWADGGILRRYQLPHHLHPPGL